MTRPSLFAKLAFLRWPLAVRTRPACSWRATHRRSRRTLRGPRASGISRKMRGSPSFPRASVRCRFPAKQEAPRACSGPRLGERRSSSTVRQSACRSPLLVMPPQMPRSTARPAMRCNGHMQRVLRSSRMIAHLGIHDHVGLLQVDTHGPMHVGSGWTTMATHGLTRRATSDASSKYKWDARPNRPGVPDRPGVRSAHT